MRLSWQLFGGMEGVLTWPCLGHVRSPGRWPTQTVAFDVSKKSLENAIMPHLGVARVSSRQVNVNYEAVNYRKNLIFTRLITRSSFHRNLYRVRSI